MLCHIVFAASSEDLLPGAWPIGRTVHTPTRVATFGRSWKHNWGGTTVQTWHWGDDLFRSALEPPNGHRGTNRNIPCVSWSPGAIRSACRWVVCAQGLWTNHGRNAASHPTSEHCARGWGKASAPRQASPPGLSGACGCSQAVLLSRKCVIAMASSNRKSKETDLSLSLYVYIYICIYVCTNSSWKNMPTLSSWHFANE